MGRKQDEWMQWEKEGLQWDGEGEKQTAGIRVWGWSHSASISPSNPSFETTIYSEGFFVDGAKSLEKIQVLSEIKKIIGEPNASYAGTLRLEVDDKSIALRMTMGVSGEIFDKLYRVFLDGSSENQLWMNLTLTHPNWSHPTFWKTGWQECDLTISHFELFYKRDVMPSERERYN